MSTFKYTDREKYCIRNLHCQLRHNAYDKRLTGADLDWVEFNCTTKEPVAFFETKFPLVKEIDLNDDQFTKLYNMANKSNLPAFGLVYYILNKKGRLMEGNYESHKNHEQDFMHAEFFIIPVNEIAFEFYNEPILITEVELESFLGRLRGYTSTEPRVELCDSFWRDWEELPACWANLPEPPEVIPRVRQLGRQLSFNF